MHTLRNRVIFFGSALAAGLASLGLHSYMLNNCLDARGLLIPGNLPGRLLWAVGIVFVLGLTVMLRTIGGDGGYEDNFPACYLSGTLLIAAGLCMAWAVPGLETVEQPPRENSVLLIFLTGWVRQVLPWAAAVSMVVLGGFRMAGRRPWPVFSGIICLFYMLMLMHNYRSWSADPRVHEYVYQLLAGMLLMLCAFHRTCCDAGIIQRRKLLATGLCASVCCMGALSGQFQWGFYLASGLWAAGAVCNVAVLPPDPEDAEETAETE